MELTLGPVLFNWKAAAWRDFYFRVADEAPIDTVVVGETVCSKRLPLVADYLPDVVERLQAAGKTVLLSSLALVTLDRERRATAELAESSGQMVEANDVTCLAYVKGRPHAVGPMVPIYNEMTAEFLARDGAVRICLPPELPARSIAAIAGRIPNVVFEVFGFGRAPLAISTRCYHARASGLTKDNCRYVCERDPDGMLIRTLDDEPFVAVNGVQTLGATCTNLVLEVEGLRSAGVGAVRLSPHSCDMVAVAHVFRDVLDRHISAADGVEKLAAIFPEARFSNGFPHGAAGATWVADKPMAPN